MEDWSPIKTPRMAISMDSMTDMYDELFDPTCLSPQKRRDDSFSADVDAIDSLKCQIEQLKTQLCDAKAQTIRISKSLHSTLLTARNQMNRCQQDINQLHNSIGKYVDCLCRLKELLLVVCPHCSSSFTATGSGDPTLLTIKPKYTRVIKGRRIVEVAFEDMDVLKKWLKYVHLHINSDGLPTLIDDAIVENIGNAQSLLHAGSLLVEKNVANTQVCGNIDNYRIPLKLASEPKLKLSNKSKQQQHSSQEQKSTMPAKNSGADENVKLNSTRRNSMTVETTRQRQSSRSSRDRRPDSGSSNSSSRRRRSSRDRSRERGRGGSRYNRRLSNERNGRHRSRDRDTDRRTSSRR